MRSFLSQIWIVFDAVLLKLQVKLTPVLALIRINLDPTQENGPKAGGGRWVLFCETTVTLNPCVNTTRNKAQLTTCYVDSNWQQQSTHNPNLPPCPTNETIQVQNVFWEKQAYKVGTT